MQLYHFTDVRNLPSIRRRGLLSWRRLVDQGVIHHPASNSLSRYLDTRAGLDDYVRLCLSERHPLAFRVVMEGRVRELAWLRVDPTILRFGARYSNKNATANDVRIDDDPSTATGSSDLQAEVLIPGFIATKWLWIP